MNDDDKFFAWLDGELAPAEAAEMEAKVAVAGRPPREACCGPARSIEGPVPRGPAEPWPFSLAATRFRCRTGPSMFTVPPGIDQPTRSSHAASATPLGGGGSVSSFHSLSSWTRVISG